MNNINKHSKMEVINTKKRVKTELARAFYSMPAIKLNDVQDEIMDKLQWCMSTFYAKRNGQRAIRKPEHEALKQIFNSYGVNYKLN